VTLHHLHLAIDLETIHVIHCDSSACPEVCRNLTAIPLRHRRRIASADPGTLLLTFRKTLYQLLLELDIFLKR